MTVIDDPGMIRNKRKRILPLDAQERMAIFDALTMAKGNVPKAAVMLGIGVATVYRKIKKYGWRRGDGGGDSEGGGNSTDNEDSSASEVDKAT